MRQLFVRPKHWRIKLRRQYVNIWPKTHAEINDDKAKQKKTVCSLEETVFALEFLAIERDGKVDNHGVRFEPVLASKRVRKGPASLR